MIDGLDPVSQVVQAATTQRGEVLKVVGFTLNAQEYVVDILKVKEIKLMMPITRVPKSPTYIEGVANLRGDIIPVVDLRKKLKMPPTLPSEETRIIVIELESRLVGMIVDSVTENYDLRLKDISAPPAAIATIDAAFVRGVAKIGERLLIFLEIERLMAPPEPLLAVPRTIPALPPAPGS